MSKSIVKDLAKVLSKYGLQLNTSTISLLVSTGGGSILDLNNLSNIYLKAVGHHNISFDEAIEITNSIGYLLDAHCILQFMEGRKLRFFSCREESEGDNLSKVAIKSSGAYHYEFFISLSSKLLDGYIYHPQLIAYYILNLINPIYYQLFTDYSGIIKYIINWKYIDERLQFLNIILDSTIETQYIKIAPKNYETAFTYKGVAVGIDISKDLSLLRKNCKRVSISLSYDANQNKYVEEFS